MLLNGNVGWLNCRLKNLREAQNKIKRQQPNNNVETNANSSDDLDYADQELNDSEANKLIQVLKSTVVGPQTIDLIMAHLASTRKHRHKMLLDKDLDLKQEFPYFFTHPNLVSLWRNSCSLCECM